MVTDLSDGVGDIDIDIDIEVIMNDII